MLAITKYIIVSEAAWRATFWIGPFLTTHSKRLHVYNRRCKAYNESYIKLSCVSLQSDVIIFFDTMEVPTTGLKCTARLCYTYWNFMIHLKSLSDQNLQPFQCDETYTNSSWDARGWFILGGRLSDRLFYFFFWQNENDRNNFGHCDLVNNFSEWL